MNIALRRTRNLIEPCIYINLIHEQDILRTFGASCYLLAIQDVGDRLLGIRTEGDYEQER